ncbi:hybrid sensor histidine kinase/response regulator transcription factor [Mucilaginibacter sp. FT3.2]|uniref:hybrid sensor histidine kinase/response regulator transcription factor n=1 Tax=Mucilaginibacter sp. FT3.2 TaxID=2723090 RepID=UPI00160970DE|nr:hybrid sensor histidine kinase/response regulator transcription factor [Mucilaginibacter sp. FT3.2]MBB6229923.1 signal transduction histidine kinase/ligand-binding sensor domain-containing protein/DNA-binding NarL/FixJ family response regulator [Mucilaginibacter sp. FT3.2]
MFNGTAIILKRKIYLCAVLILVASRALAVNLNQPIRYLGIENGLSNNAVTCIYQDTYGFMWMGTYDGLNRYDSDKFKIFRNIWGDPKSLVYNHITALGGAGNKVLVGTQRGLAYYSYADSYFYPEYYLAHNKTQKLKITTIVSAIVADKQGNIYVAADEVGLLKYNPQLKVYEQLALSGKYNYNIQALALGDNGLWLFVKDVGLCFYDIKRNAIGMINGQLKFANCLIGDKRDNIWIGTENGLYTFNYKTNSFNKYRPAGGGFTSENIFNFSFDEKGDLWVATNGGGVNILNLSTNKLSYILTGNTSGSLHSGAVNAIYQDKEARKWIATLRGGVSIVDNHDKPFFAYSHDPFDKNSVVNKFILSFCEDELHNVWIGTDGGGLSYWDTKKNLYTSFIHQPQPGWLSSNFIVSILKTFDNKIWVASFNGGIDAFIKSTGKFKHYTCYNTFTKTADNNLWKLYEDSHHRLWAGTTRDGALYLYNSKADRFEVFDKKLTNIHSLFEDHEGTLWAGDYSNLIKVDAINKNSRYFNIGYSIRSITEDKLNRLWVGTEGGGLLLYNTANNTYKRFTQTDGLPSNSVLNILVDDKDNLWCSTYNGLTQYSPKTGRFTNFIVSDGLQSLQFNYNAGLRLQSGQMLFGGINGFNMFSPDSIKIEDHQPALHLTGLKINNKEMEGSNKYLKDQSIVGLKKIVLPYDQATLTIDYTALEYSFPDKIEYAYYLDGWDLHWNYVGKIKSAYYTHLDEGDYTLRIKATDTRGNWTVKQIAIRIVVLPPWYRTWWAYAIYLSMVSAVIYAFYSYRVKQAGLKFEVKLANLQVEKEKELNEKKLAFFTNVSHEFRTPLTLIINPIKDLLNQNKGFADELNVIYRNARRLLGLVDHLLLFRKTESENTQLKVSKLNFVSLCHEVFACFINQAKIKKLNYTFEQTTDYLEVYADLEKIEIALFNLISNAIKFTPDNGNINIIVQQDGGNVYFKITDNGIGINADIGDKLFDKFYQIKDKNYFKTGFGIGLYLVKVFVNNHKGNISYSNNTNGGTTFVLSLPKGNQHFVNEQIVENTTPDYKYVNEFIDHDNRDSVVPEEELNKLELFISEKHTIIIIDDNDQIRTYIKKIFTPDYTVIEARNGTIGLDLIKKHIPDVIISDIVMDGISGLELCRIVKEDSTINHIPVILLTGDATPDIMVKSIEEGAIDFIRKPFDKELLSARVKSVLRSKTELQKYFYKEVTKKNTTHNISQEHKDFLNNCIAIIEHYFTDNVFDVYVLAKEMGISYPTLFKRIKTITGQSINNFIRFVRLRKAAELLIHTNCNVNEAAFQVGFSDTKYFREQFNKQFGVNPSEFIKKHRANFQVSYRMNEFEKISSK